jgi:hypothetical protein
LFALDVIFVNENLDGDARYWGQFPFIANEIIEEPNEKLEIFQYTDVDGGCCCGLVAHGV